MENTPNLTPIYVLKEDAGSGAEIEIFFGVLVHDRGMSLSQWLLLVLTITVEFIEMSSLAAPSAGALAQVSRHLPVRAIVVSLLNRQASFVSLASQLTIKSRFCQLSRINNIRAIIPSPFIIVSPQQTYPHSCPGLSVTIVPTARWNLHLQQQESC